MIALVAASFAASPPEGSRVVLNPPPPFSLSGPLPPGTFAVPPWDAGAAQIVEAGGARRSNPAAVQVVAVGDDGAMLVSRAGEGIGYHLWEIGPDGTSSPAWHDAPRPSRGVVRSAGRWWISSESEVVIHASDGTAVGRVATPCSGWWMSVDEGALLRCVQRDVGATWLVRAEGVAEPAAHATKTAPGGIVELGLVQDDLLEVALIADGRHGPTARVHFGELRPSPLGRWLLSGAEVIDLETGGRHHWLPHARGWTADGDVLVGPFRHDPLTGLGRPRPEGHGGEVVALAWSSDGTQLASAGADGAVLVWDPAGGAPVHRLDGDRAIVAIAWAVGNLVVTRADATVAIWRPEESAPRFEISIRLAGGRGQLPQPLSDGRILFRDDDGAVHVVGADGAELALWRAPPGPVRELVALGPRAFAAVGGMLWEVGRDEPLVVGVHAIRALSGGRLRLMRGGPQDRDWRPPGADETPVAPLLPRGGLVAVAPTGAIAVARSDGIHVLPVGPLADRAPRALAVIARPGDLPDADALIAGLRIGHVAGDRVTWLAPTASDVSWIDVDDPHAAERLRALAPIGGDGSSVASACAAARGSVADPDGLAVVVVGFGEIGRCDGAGRAARPDEVLAVVRTGWQ